MQLRIINTTLKQDSDLFTLQELAQLCKYNIPVEIMEQDELFKFNTLFNLEDLDSFSTQEVTKLNLGIDTAISLGKLSMQQWSMLFETNSNTQSAVLAEAIHSLRYQQKNDQSICLKKAGQNIAYIQQQLYAVSRKDEDFIKKNLFVALK